MNHVILRTIFMAAHTAVEYIPGEGALCPVCSQILGLRVRARVVNTAGDGIRYCSCAQCGITFKSVEKPIPKADIIEPVGKTPQTIAKPRAARQNKAKRR